MDNNVLRLLALELDMPSLLNLCLSNKRLNREICENNHFWRNKLYKDYPETKGKVFGNNLRKVYLSLVNKVYKTYYVFVSRNNENSFPKIFDYVTDSAPTEEDYEKAANLFSDFEERIGEEQEFTIIGEYPTGTKIWLAYFDNFDFGISKAFISREQAIEALLKIADELVKSDFEFVEEETGIPEEEFHKGTYEEVITRNRDTLERTNHLEIPGHDSRGHIKFFPLHFILEELTLN